MIEDGCCTQPIEHDAHFSRPQDVGQLCSSTRCPYLLDLFRTCRQAEFCVLPCAIDKRGVARRSDESTEKDIAVENDDHPARLTASSASSTACKISFSLRFALASFARRAASRKIRSCTASSTK